MISRTHNLRLTKTFSMGLWFIGANISTVCLNHQKFFFRSCVTFRQCSLDWTSRLGNQSKGKLKPGSFGYWRQAVALICKIYRILVQSTDFPSTLKSLIKVPQSARRAKKVLYDFLSAMTLSKINYLFHDSTLFQCNSSNFGIIGNSIAKKVRTAGDFGAFFP